MVLYFFYLFVFKSVGYLIHYLKIKVATLSLRHNPNVEFWSLKNKCFILKSKVRYFCLFKNMVIQTPSFINVVPYHKENYFFHLFWSKFRFIFLYILTINFSFHCGLRVVFPWYFNFSVFQSHLYLDFSC